MPPSIPLLSRKMAWPWAIQALVCNAVGFYFLSRNPNFKQLFGPKEQGWLVNAVWFASLYLVSFLLICSFLLGSQFKDKCKNCFLLDVFLTYIFLVVPAVIGHLSEYPEFHIKVTDVKLHNPQKIHALYAACSFAISSWGLSETYGLPFETGFFSICLGYAMTVSLTIVNKTGNNRHFVFILGTYSFCFIVILWRKYLEKNEDKNTTRQRDDQNPENTNTPHLSPDNSGDSAYVSPVSAFNTNDLQDSPIELVGRSALNRPNQSSEMTPRYWRVQDCTIQRNIRQESWDINEQNCDNVPPRPYYDTSSNFGDTEYGGGEEDYNLFGERTSDSNDCVDKIEVSEVLGQEIGHEERARSSGLGGYEKDGVHFLPPNSNNIVDDETQVMNIGSGQMERSKDQSQESGSPGYETDGNQSSRKVDEECDDDDPNHESSDGEESDGDDGTGGKLGVGQRQGQKRDCRRGNMRHVRDDRWEIGSDRCGPKMGQEQMLPTLIPVCLDKPNNLASVQSQSTPKVIFPNLERLDIKLANKLSFPVTSYQNLKTLRVSECNSISKLPPINVLENLEELEVEYCKSLKVIFDTEETREAGTQSVVKTSHLRKLTLHWLPKLKHVWNKDPQEFVDFQCLSVIEVLKCDSLKYLFPVSVAKALVKLQRLEIKQCRKLETIVGRIEKGADVSINFVFSQLTILILVDLPNLTRFYCGAYSTKWPRLQEIWYYSDWNTFVSGITEFEKFHCQDGLDESVQLPLPMEKREKPNNQIKIEEHEEVKVKNMGVNVVEEKISVCPESRDTDLQTSTNEVFNMNPPLAAISQVYQSSGNMPSGIDLSEAEDTMKDFPNTLEVSYKVPRKEGKNKHLADNLNYDASSSGEITPQLLSAVPKNNKGENVEGRAQETAQKDPTSEKVEPEIIEKLPKSELVLIDQQHALKENKGDPIRLDAVTPSLLEDLLSRLCLLLSSEAMTYLRDGFAHYPWPLHLLESWSDECWNWSYFVIFARVLCILQTTTAANLSEAVCSELSCSLSTLENVGFDANWIAAVHTRIHEAKALRATEDAIAGQLTENDSPADAMAEFAETNALLVGYAHKEELAHKVIGLP